ncbi:MULTISPECIES: TetR/AcrR family transcriptional regulator [Actinomadura]|uniref:TetR/AcrR family transcriptional regulator n=1 Tax=Actinomadura yumaensis TaxID=111807 RepID=A0ABW2CQM6_9ACTN|nr:TetR/AcrR family transcriptional regulator [Actinomadura sp. J1-007]MWK37498.1 TetR family transcriptional regulator [Actinomadura sp. J1-007]
MSVQQRRERERAERHRLIVQTAREMAEAEGWESVTTRRLAERVEYSQPVLYSHFKSKGAIVAAVAIDGFGDMAYELYDARISHESPEESLRAVADAYLRFAGERPALYDAMFVQRIDVSFGSGESPANLQAAFNEFVTVLRPLAGERDLESLAEVIWSSLHGIATLSAGNRLRPELHQVRLDLLIDQVVAGRT